MRRASLPPLITISQPGTPQGQAGVLGAPGTAVVFGQSAVNGDERPGARFELGYWLDCDQTIGVQLDFFMLGDQVARGQSSSPDASSIIGRPFLDAASRNQNAELVSFPGLVAGSVQATASSTGMVGAGVQFRENLCCNYGCGCCGRGYRLDIIGGYRFLRLADHLEVTESLTAIDPNNRFGVAPGTNIVVADDFRTRNEFNGFDIGLAGEIRRNRLVLEFLAKLGMGWNNTDVDINGGTTINVPGTPSVTNVGGLLALPSNIGHFPSDHLAFITELGLKLGYQLTPHVRAFAGYNFLFWTDVARAGDQVDLSVNPTRLPASPTGVTGAARPAFHFRPVDVYLEDINLGLEVRF